MTPRLLAQNWGYKLLSLVLALLFYWFVNGDRPDRFSPAARPPSTERLSVPPRAP